MTARTSALPRFSDVHQDHTVQLADGVYVVFQVVAIPGARYNEILEECRGDDGKVRIEDTGVPILTAGINRVYSSVESTPIEFTQADAEEIWETWPEWARTDVYSTVIAYSTRGPAADPFSGSTRNGNDAD